MNIVDLNLAAKPIKQASPVKEIHFTPEERAELFVSREERFKNFPYKTREDVEKFIALNPIAFREAIESNEMFRENFKVLLQTFDTGDMKALSWLMQEDLPRNSDTGSKMLLATVSMDFFEWSHLEWHNLKANMYHELGSFNTFHEKREQERKIEKARHQEWEEEKTFRDKNVTQAVEVERKSIEQILKISSVDMAIEMRRFSEALRKGGFDFDNEEVQSFLLKALDLSGTNIKTGNKEVDVQLGLLSLGGFITVSDRLNSYLKQNPNSKIAEYFNEQGVNYASDRTRLLHVYAQYLVENPNQPPQPREFIPTEVLRTMNDAKVAAENGNLEKAGELGKKLLEGAAAYNRGILNELNRQAEGVATNLGVKEGVNLGVNLGVKEGVNLGVKEGVNLGVKEGVNLGVKDGVGSISTSDAERIAKEEEARILAELEAEEQQKNPKSSVSLDMG